MKCKNWTLVELMMIIVIISLLTLIAFPSVITNRQVAFDRVRNENINMISKAVTRYLISNPDKTLADVNDLNTIKSYLDEANDSYEELKVGGFSISIENGVASYADAP